jgi:hypothetical protein
MPLPCAFGEVKFVAPADRRWGLIKKLSMILNIVYMLTELIGMI